MAKSQVQPLLLLLAPLFFVSTLSIVNFEYCNKSGYDFGKVSSVEISPNPVGANDHVLNITINGYASKSIDKGIIRVLANSTDTTDLLRQSEISVEASSNFVFSLSEVLKDILEGDYKYVIRLLERIAGGSKEPIVKMCVEFDLPTSSSTLVST